MNYIKLKISFLFLLFVNCNQIYSQIYPAFGQEIKVTINNLTFDAMEPFISPDGYTLFFNSLNSGGNTNLHYATKINDSTFNYNGLIGGCYDSSSNHIDAVASSDSSNNFFWVSLRNYPSVIENLHRGIYSSGNVTGITRVYGDFNINTFGWIIMDAAINYNGNQLYFCNAYFDFINNSCGSGVPCHSKLDIAQKINDSTFNKIIDSDMIFSNINDTNFLVYAPHITKDGLEIYYTRLLKNSVNTEICVSVRNNISEIFSTPIVIYSNLGFVPEAATMTTDKQRIYYHKKDQTGIFKIFLRYRENTTDIITTSKDNNIKLLLNKVNNIIEVILPDKDEKFEIQILSLLGQKLITISDKPIIDISHISKGIYIITLKQNNFFYSIKICL